MEKSRPRSHPKLDVGHALECAAKLQESCYERDDAEDGDTLHVHAQQVAQGNSQCCAQKKLTVGEPELESEQERERHTYADDSA